MSQQNRHQKRHEDHYKHSWATYYAAACAANDTQTVYKRVSDGRYCLTNVRRNKTVYNRAKTKKMTVITINYYLASEAKKYDYAD